MQVNRYCKQIVDENDRICENNALSLGKETLRLLRDTDSIDAEWDLATIEWEHAQTLNEDKTGTLKQMLKSRSVRRALVLGSLLKIFQQFTGINAIHYYSTSIMVHNGLLDTRSAIWASAVIGAISVVSIPFGIYAVERFGRKPLLLISTSLTAFSLLFVSISFYLHG